MVDVQIEATLERDLMRTMFLIRRFEEMAGDMRRHNVISGDMHFAIGQEAVAAGICAAMQEGDYLAVHHRCHSHLLARGMDPGVMLADLCGRIDGSTKGKGGHMNLNDRRLNILGGNNVIGPSVALAAGAALASQHRKDGLVAVGVIGDAGSSTGLFHETLNMAALWRLPVVLVVENNQYSISTPLSVQVAGGDIARRAEGYGIPGFRVDGNDPVEVYAVMSEATARARRGDGPSLIEAVTYRIAGHWSGDWGGYRSVEEVKQAESHDPMVTYPARLLNAGIVDQAGIEAMTTEIDARLMAARKFAEAAAPTPTADVLVDVFEAGEDAR